MCCISLKSNWAEHGKFKAFIFPEKNLPQKISSLCPFNMSEAAMCVLTKTEYSINEIVFLVLIPNESYSTIKHIFIKLYYIVYREFIYLFMAMDM